MTNKRNKLTDRTHTCIVSFIVLDCSTGIQNLVFRTYLDFEHFDLGLILAVARLPPSV